MARDGSGNYTLPAAYFALTGTTVASAHHNTPFEDVATALTGLCRATVLRL